MNETIQTNSSTFQVPIFHLHLRKGSLFLSRWFTGAFPFLPFSAPFPKSRPPKFFGARSTAGGFFENRRKQTETNKKRRTFLATTVNDSLPLFAFIFSVSHPFSRPSIPEFPLISCSSHLSPHPFRAFLSPQKTMSMSYSQRNNSCSASATLPLPIHRTASFSPSLLINANKLLNDRPQLIDCPRCKFHGQTELKFVTGLFTWISFLVLLIAGVFVLPLFFLWVPFFVDTFKDAEHYCPGCKTHIGTFRRLGK